MMKTLFALTCLSLWLSCGGKKSMEQNGQDEKPNVVEISSGFTVEVASKVTKQEKVKGTTYVQVKGRELFYSFSRFSDEEKDPNKTCEQQILDSLEKMKKASAEDPENFKKLIVTRSEKRCDLHDACILLEMGQRSPDEYQSGKPYREVIAYHVCLDEQDFGLMGFLLPAGTPVTDENRAVMKQVVQSLKRTEKP